VNLVSQEVVTMTLSSVLDIGRKTTAAEQCTLLSVGLGRAAHKNNSFLDVARCALSDVQCSAHLSTNLRAANMTVDTVTRSPNE